MMITWQNCCLIFDNLAYTKAATFIILILLKNENVSLNEKPSHVRSSISMGFSMM